MVLHRVTLLLIGAAMASAQFVPRVPDLFEFHMLPGGCPPTSEMAPMICKFMQQNLAFPYKPQLIAPSTYIPPLVLEKCDTPKLETEIELAMPVEEKRPIIIPEAPVLPPITLPKFPVPVMVEEPVEKPMAEPCEPVFVPEMPVMSIPAPELPIPAFHHIVEVPEMKEPVFIPQPPELSTFVMPELPVRVAEPPVITELGPEEPTYVVSVPEYIQPAAIPAAPELPAFSKIVELPKEENLFKPIEIPQPPELSAFVMPELPVRVAEPPVITEPFPEEPTYFVSVPEYIQPAAIPAAPELPAFSKIVELPKEENLFKPIEIPQPPELSAFVMPELPVRVAEPPVITEPFPEEPTYFVSVPEYIQPAAIPAAPELPAFSKIVELPKDENLFKPIEIPQPPELSAFVMPELPLQIAEQTLMVAPCAEDKLTEIVPIPEFVKPLAPIPAAPELPPAVLPELPVRIDLPQPIVPTVVAEEPCVTGEEPKVEPVLITKPSIVPEFIVPEPFNMEIMKPFTMPVLPAYHGAAVIADPCESSAQPIVKMADLQPYFITNAPYVFGNEKFLSLPYITPF